MTATKISRIAQAIVASLIVGTTSVGCAAPASAPDQAVALAFRAYMSGDKSGVNRQLSRVGEASADFFCQGDGWACMTDSYQRLGANLFSAVEVTRQKDSSARVQLRTKWANYPEAVCQEYSVDRIEGGWGISYIDVLKKC